MSLALSGSFAMQSSAHPSPIEQDAHTTTRQQPAQNAQIPATSTPMTLYKIVRQYSPLPATSIWQPAFVLHVARLPSARVAALGGFHAYSAISLSGLLSLVGSITCPCAARLPYAANLDLTWRPGRFNDDI